MATNRHSFVDQIHGGRSSGASGGASRQSTISCETIEEKMKLAGEIDNATDSAVATFESKFKPSDMRQLALVAHNHMKPAMREFISTYSEILKKFRITGTQTTMRMCKSLWGEDNPDIEYGLTCTSGPLGGDAQIAALMCMEDLGALIFFVDPLSAHPHQADIDSLIRLANVGNVIVCPNPTSGMSMLYTLKTAIETGNRGMIPSFFETLESPAVEEYKNNQELALAAAVSAKTPTEIVRPMLALDQSTYFADEDEDDDYDDFDVDEALDKLQQIQVPGTTGIADSYHGQAGRRGSGLSGIKVKDAPKKRKKLIKTMAGSMKRLGLKM